MILPRSLVLGIAVPFSFAMAQSVPEPIVAYDFNESGTTVESVGKDRESTLTLVNGAAPSAPGVGVSGRSDDRALSLLSAIGMGQAPGGVATRATTAPLSGLSSFTLTGWFVTADTTSINAAARLIDAGTSFFLGGAENGSLVLGVNGKVAAVPGSRFSATQQWVFFAVSYDGTKPDQNVKFYTGTVDAPAELAGHAVDLPGGSIGRIGVLNVGNREFNNYDRPFHGLIDDVKIFGAVGSSDGVLSLAQIQKVQKQTVQSAR